MATTTTKHGETWDMISKRMYGDEHWVHRLIDANWLLRDTRIFSAGVKIVVPDLPEDAVVASTLPPWKRA